MMRGADGTRCRTRTGTALTGLEILSLPLSFILLLSGSATSFVKGPSANYWANVGFGLTVDSTRHGSRDGRG